ncbi:MAG: bacillithiol biosynthesis cysteine-adding enzyme BshC [Acidobacteria bacterium]|nr:bacillithiol biosynthesis cysteine-adding enzyme BshC [Acidobacteriota bacterium]
MNAQCFPFRQIPHSTPLFLDYLDFKPSVQRFYACSPRFREWAVEESSHIQYPGERRSRVADILERQNRAFQASRKAFESISRLRSGAWAMVTGQQVGLFGGPVFAIYKALTAIKLAEEASTLGLDCVPVFWLATEDHDLEEVNQAKIPTAGVGCEQLRTNASSPREAPVGTVSLGVDVSAIVQHAQTLLGDGPVTQLLADCYKPGETFGTAFRRFFAHAFADSGVILVDGSDPELDQIAAPLYKQVIARATELNHLLLGRDQELRAAQYHQQVHITPSTTPLFVLREGARVPLHLGRETKVFLIGKERVLDSDLLELTASAPDSFSPNVLLRPVVQDYLLPTLAYIGGAAEVAYFAQAAVLYQALSARTTPIVPRFSATLIEPRAKTLLEKYQLNFPDLFSGQEALRERIGWHWFGHNLQSSFDRAQAAVSSAMAELSQALGRLDKTLVESAEHAESKMLYQLTSLRSRAVRAELRQSEVAERHARGLTNSLYPNKTLQEREVSAIYFLAKYGLELLPQLLGVIHSDCVDHQLITL